MSETKSEPEAQDILVQPKPSFSSLRRWVLVVAFSLSQFLDSVNISAIFTSIPAIAKDLDFLEGQTVWLLSAYQLTFAGFLLVSGRLADLFNPKYLFTGGFSSLGILSIGAGFVQNKIGLIVLRAFTGIAAATTIPSALHLIINLFDDQEEQAKALGLFGGGGAFGNVLGIIIAALFVQFQTWRWIFWFNSCLAIPISLACLFLIPSSKARGNQETLTGPSDKKIKHLDIFGVSAFTIAVLLFIFALTSTSATGWNSARVLVPLIVSIVMAAGVFYYETRIPEEKAALPPRIWFYPNFSVLCALALIPYLWWSAVLLVLMSYWQEFYQYTPILTAVRMLPLGVLAFPVMVASASLQSKFKLRWFLLAAFALLIPATILLPFADRPSRYWPIVFPAFVLGTTGNTMIFAVANVAIFNCAPKSMSGTVGAIVNSSLQLGSALGLAIVTSIESNVESTHGGPAEYTGRAAGYWFLAGVVIFEFIAMMIFIRDMPSEEQKTDK